MPDSEYALDRGEILRYLGYRGQEIGPELDREIRRMGEECLRCAKPRYLYRVFPVELRGDAPVIGGVELLGEDIARHLRGAVSCAVMAATLGHEPERAMLRLGQRSTVSQVVFNAACTALIESVSDACEGEITRYAGERGLLTSYRYSPGYGDFPLTQQRQILGLLEAETRLGITLTDSMLMLPRKSVSALIGLYPQGSGVRRGGTTCQTCENYENCEFRKEGCGCGG